MFHVYECQNCVLSFAVEQALEDQSNVCCPLCQEDYFIRDICSGVMKLKEQKTPAGTGVGKK